MQGNDDFQPFPGLMASTVARSQLRTEHTNLGTFKAALIKAAPRRTIASHLRIPKAAPRTVVTRFPIQRIRTLGNLMCVDVRGILDFSQ